MPEGRMIQQQHSIAPARQAARVTHRPVSAYRGLKRNSVACGRSERHMPALFTADPLRAFPPVGRLP